MPPPRRGAQRGERYQKQKHSEDKHAECNLSEDNEASRAWLVRRADDAISRPEKLLCESGPEPVAGKPELLLGDGEQKR